MIIIDYINRLLGKPPILPNGYPDVAQTVTRRINGGNYDGFYIPPPPPAPMYSTPKEEPLPPMVSEIVNKIISEPVRTTPSTTSSLWCGTTITDITSTLTAPKDPLVLDHLQLKYFLVKKYPWILDVTEVRIKPLGRLTHPIYESTIVYGPLEIHITVSPIHHSELMNPEIEKRVREKLYVDLISLITCMYENNNKDKPIIIFSPSHSETILEYVK